jgi:GNAT superfamily N-acetyltransferase
MPEPLTVAPEPLAGPAATALIALLDAELTERYPSPADRHFTLAAEQVAEGHGVFLVARAGGEPVGCGALRRLDAATGELKRMYVTPAARGAGIGRRILVELEGHARRLGLRRLVLETGDAQHEAMGLYESAGFARIACYGEYLASRASVCMGKRLVTDDPTTIGPDMVASFQRLHRHLRGLVEGLDAEALAWRPAPDTTPISNIVLHVLGAARVHLLVAMAAPEERHRESEFNAPPLSATELVERIDAARAELDRYRDLTVADLVAVRPRPARDEAWTGLQVLLNAYGHFTGHLTQIELTLQLYASRPL